MKKLVMAAALAGVVLLSGCSGVSQDEYNSLVEENSRLQSENTSLQNNSSEKTSNEENSTSKEDDEYRMPKDHVKRVAKVLTMPENTLVTQSSNGLDMKQYNVKSSVFMEAYKDNNKGQLKQICNISTNNTVQEKAAFVYYFLGVHMRPYLEKEIENGCENIVTVVNDNNGNPIVVWLIYDNGDEIKHDMNFVDTDVLKATDEVIEDSDKWKPTENQQIYPLPETSIPQSSTSTQTEKPTESKTPPVQNTATTGEKNALKKAKSYLEYSAFSRDGLIGQLEFEGYTNSEATYGVDNVGADWNEQAIKKAGQYLEYSAFSYTGLVEQLEFEKFTHEQAVYGVDNCGADWNEQAVKKAAQYLEYSSFSKDGLIGQLEFEGFTHDQAVYGVTQNGY